MKPGIYALALLVTGASPVVQKPAADNGPVPVDVFAELPTMEGPKLSPDGTHVAAKMAIKGKQYLVVMPLRDTKAAKTMRIGDKMDVNWWRWVGDKWLAVGIGAQDTIYGEEVYVTRMLGVPADLSSSKQIDWSRSGIRADEVLWTAKDGSPRILFAKQTGIESMDQVYPSVFEADLSTGRAKLVADGQRNVWNWYADGQGQVRIGYRYNDESRKAMLLYRDRNGEPFRTIARADRKRDEGMVVPLTFRPDGSALAFDDSEGFDALYEVSLPNLKLGKKLYAAQGYDLDGLIDNAAETDADGVNVTDTFGHTVWFNPALKQIQEDVDKAVGARRARIVSWNSDRSKLLVEVGRPSQAGALYFWDTAYGNMQRYAWNNDTLKGRVLSPVSTVHYTARDGTSIEAVLTLPRLRAPKNLPLIVLPHGGPFARDSEGWDWWVQYLAELGYVVIQPNYRGSSGYGIDFAKKGEGQWGLKMQDDLDDAIPFLAKQGIADPKRVCMIGASYGGYAAMRAAQRNGDLYRCAVSYAGVSDLAAMQRYDGQFLFGKTRGDWLKKQAPDYRAVSPRFGAAAFTIPILLVHGREDKRVPVKQSRMMADALKAAGKPYDYIEQPLADHHFTRGEDRLEFLKAMAAFLAKHNPA